MLEEPTLTGNSGDWLRTIIKQRLMSYSLVEPAVLNEQEVKGKLWAP